MNLYSDYDMPKVGIGVILMKFNDKSVLLGKRKNAHGEGTWSFPGGHLEKFESFPSCAMRELKEETGFESGLNYYLIDTFPMPVTNDFFEKEQKHYVTLYLKAEHRIGEPKNKEPDKCEGWAWYQWEKLPELNLFTPVRNLLKQDYNPFNSK